MISSWTCRSDSLTTSSSMTTLSPSPTLLTSCSDTCMASDSTVVSEWGDEETSVFTDVPPLSDFSSTLSVKGCSNGGGCCCFCD